MTIMFGGNAMMTLARILTLVATTAGGQAEKKPYEPVAADFRRVYDLDSANRAKETFDDYFGNWIDQFYNKGFKVPILGIRVAPPWLEAEATVLASLAPVSRAEYRARLDALGFRISAEWAKDNSVHRISKEDLKSWGDQLAAASRQNQGGDATSAVSRVLGKVETEVQTKLKNGPRVPLPDSISAALAQSHHVQGRRAAK